MFVFCGNMVLTKLFPLSGKCIIWESDKSPEQVRRKNYNWQQYQQSERGGQGLSREGGKLLLFVKHEGREAKQNRVGFSKCEK